MKKKEGLLLLVSIVATLFSSARNCESKHLKKKLQLLNSDQSKDVEGKDRGFQNAHLQGKSLKRRYQLKKVKRILERDLLLPQVGNLLGPAW